MSSLRKTGNSRSRDVLRVADVPFYRFQGKCAIRFLRPLPPEAVLRSQAGPPAWGDPSGVKVLRTCFATLRPQLGAPLPPSRPARQKVARHTNVMGVSLKRDRSSTYCDLKYS